MGKMGATGDLMNRIKFLQVICASALLAFLFPQKYAQAQDLNFVEIPLETFHDEQPIELSGLFSTQTLNIPVPQSWLPGEENWIEVKTRASSLLDLGRSSLTISLNGSHISSYRLQKIAETKQRILIPANIFTQGNNTLTFTGTLYLPDDHETNCQNWDDPSRWLTVEPGGMLHLSFVRRDLTMDLSNFPQVFIEPLEGYLPDKAKRQPLFVMPEDSSQDDLTSLSTMAYVLGGDANIKYDWRPEIVSEGQFNANIAADRNIIFIGYAPTQLQNTASNDKNYIALLPSPWGQGNAVMIIGDQDRQDGFSPTSVFSDPARSILLYGNVAYIDPYLTPPPQPFRNDFSFEDLGYLDRTVRGIGQQNLIYSWYIPYDIDPTLVKLNLGLVYSPDLDIQNSSFTVYLNGFSVAGILPSAQSTPGTPITVGLPAKRFRPGINFIRVRSDLHVPYSSCERAPESVWATILSSSTLNATYRNRSPIPSLEHFPLPFSDYPGFVFVIPDQYDQSDLGYISRLSFMIGTFPHLLSYPPEVMTAGNFMQHETEHRNVILVGLPSQNSATMSTNDLLPQPFMEDGNSLQEGYGVYLPTSDKDASLGLMQIIPSPWVQGGTVLVLTGNDSQGLEWTWDVILNPNSHDQFAGNLMVVGSAHRSEASGAVSGQENPQTIFQQIADASNIPIIGPILQKWGQAFLAPALVAVGTALLLVVCVLWVISAVRNRNTPDTIEKTDK
jgi:hypothetical protein